MTAGSLQHYRFLALVVSLSALVLSAGRVSAADSQLEVEAEVIAGFDCESWEPRAGLG